MGILNAIYNRTTKKNICNILKNAISNNMDYFKIEISKLESITDEKEAEQKYNVIRKNIIKRIYSDVDNCLKLGNQTMYRRFSIFSMTFMLSDNISVGLIYSNMYKAFIGCDPLPYDCLKFNHIFQDYLDKALGELDKQYEALT